MKIKSVKQNGLVTAYVHLPNLNCPSSFTGKKQLISVLSQSIKNTGIGYAGFKTKHTLQNYLMRTVFDTREKCGRNNSALNQEKVMEVIEKTLSLCFCALPGKTIHIFVFPTFNKFVREKMSGTTGYTPWRNVMLLFINPNSRQWEKSLARTIGHEFNHSAFLKCNECKTLLDILICEGLAEHFREQVIGGGRAPWTKVLNENKSNKILLKMESGRILQSTNFAVHRAVLFGNNAYTPWTGYSIGYYILKTFLGNNLNLDWREIMTLRPKNIFEKSYLKTGI